MQRHGKSSQFMAPGRLIGGLLQGEPPGEPRTGPRRQVSDFNWMVGRLSEAQKSSNEGINNHL